MTTRVPLSVLDLTPFPSGATARDGLLASIDLARRVERLGYRRYWLAEHHLTPGIAGSAPHVLAALIAEATDHIRVGTAATIIGNYAPLQVVEAVGLVATLHPDRLDLGIGRSGLPSNPSIAGSPSVTEALAADPTAAQRFAFGSARLDAHARLLRRVPGDADRFEQDVLDVLALLDGTYVAPEGVPVHAVPGEGGRVEVWVHGSTAGPSAELAGRLGLPFGSPYHFSPTTVVDAVAAYRAAFRPGVLAEPYVIVSADVVVADTDAAARHLVTGYPAWLHGLLGRDGAIPFPSPQEALAAPLTPEQAATVQGRVDTQIVGAPATVRARLEALQQSTDADELLVTTITHDPGDRIRSYELLAREWGLAHCIER